MGRTGYNIFMTERTRKILAQALELPIDQRAELAAELLASVDGDPDTDADSVWAAEIERRARRALAGESKGKDWQAVFERLKAQGKK